MSGEKAPSSGAFFVRSKRLGHLRINILFGVTSEFFRGHESLSIFLHYVRNLLSVLDPSSAVFISRKGNKNMLPLRTQA